MKRQCLACGALHDIGEGCPNHPARNGSTRRWRRIREQILKRDGYMCTASGCTETLNLHVDHIKPRIAGGTDTPENLRVLCERHNLEKAV